MAPQPSSIPIGALCLHMTECVRLLFTPRNSVSSHSPSRRRSSTRPVCLPTGFISPAWKKNNPFHTSSLPNKAPLHSSIPSFWMQLLSELPPKGEVKKAGSKGLETSSLYQLWNLSFYIMSSLNLHKLTQKSTPEFQKTGAEVGGSFEANLGNINHIPKEKKSSQLSMQKKKTYQNKIKNPHSSHLKRNKR